MIQIQLLTEHVARLLPEGTGIVLLAIEPQDDSLIIHTGMTAMDRPTRIAAVNKLMLDVNAECLAAKLPAPFPDARPIVHPLPDDNHVS